MISRAKNPFLVVFCVACLGAERASFDVHGPDPGRDYMYIPPDLSPNTLLYHSFGRGPVEPEVNRLRASFGTRSGRLAAGFTEQGLAVEQGHRGLSLGAVEIPLSRPITVSFWFRLDSPMRAETVFHLISLHTSRGYISHFVRGKGTWCALKEPTFVIQLYNFEAISNVNGIHFGFAWLPEKTWHHVALTVSEGSRIRVYWNGRMRGEVSAKGRLFNRRDVVRTVTLGPHGLLHPMTVDEVMILDRALGSDEIQSLTTAARKLREGGFPSVCRTAPLQRPEK